MKSINSINTFLNNNKTAYPNRIKIKNNCFTGNNVATNSQLSITSTTQIFNWTISQTGSSVKILNNYTSALNSNVGTLDYNNIPTNYCLYCGQSSSQTIDFNQTIKVPTIQNYTLSFWLNCRVGLYSNLQSFTILINSVQIFTPITFTTGTTSNPWTYFSYTFTPTTTGNQTLTLRFSCSGSTDSAMMVSCINLV